jgi:hypothetical protein
MLVGKQLKTFIPEWYTPFCTLVSCTGVDMVSPLSVILSTFAIMSLPNTNMQIFVLF